MCVETYNSIGADSNSAVLEKSIRQLQETLSQFAQYSSSRLLDACGEMPSRSATTFVDTLSRVVSQNASHVLWFKLDTNDLHRALGQRRLPKHGTNTCCGSSSRESMKNYSEPSSLRSIVSFASLVNGFVPANDHGVELADAFRWLLSSIASRRIAAPSAVTPVMMASSAFANAPISRGGVESTTSLHRSNFCLLRCRNRLSDNELLDA